MIRFTVHAIARYMERVRPGVDRDAAFRDLRALSRVGRIQPQPPAWVTTSYDEGVLGWLDCGDVCFPLVRSDNGSGYAAATCLARGTIGPEIRAQRNKHRVGRQSYRYSKKKNERGREGRRLKRGLAVDAERDE